MGNYTSKFLSHDSREENDSKVVESVEQSNFVKPCDTITPPTTRRKLIDPRSITAEISRTPIEVNNSTSKNTRMPICAIPKHLQVKPYLETYFGTTTTPLTSNRYLNSNSVESETSSSVESVTSCKTPTTMLKNTCRALSSINLANYTPLGLDPRSPSVDFDRTPILVPRASKYHKTKSNENLHKCNETNNSSKFLYCETTSFDTPEILALVNETFEALKSTQLNKSDNVDLTNVTELLLKDDINHLSNERGNNDHKKNVQTENMTSTIKVWKDSLLVEDLNQSEINEYSDQECDEEKFSLCKEEIEVVFDNEPMKESTPIPEQPKTETDNKNVHDMLENKRKVKTCGKMFIPYNSNISDISIMKRTPLRSRCNNANLDTLLLKSPQHMLQNKNLNVMIQQENTPPQKKCHAKSKTKGTQWDINSTVII